MGALRRGVRKRVLPGTVEKVLATAKQPERIVQIREGLHGVTEGARVRWVGVKPKVRAVAQLVMAGARSRAIP